MVQVLLLVTGALVVGAIVFGVAVLITGGDGLGDVEPDGRSVSLPGIRPLAEGDVSSVRFDTVIRGYRMAQVDEALRRTAYDIGYKSELIGVLEAEVAALREGRLEDADALREARTAASGVVDPSDQGVRSDAEPEREGIGSDAVPTGDAAEAETVLSMAGGLDEESGEVGTGSSSDGGLSLEKR
jgi:DivIVA domain-containing protein